MGWIDLLKGKVVGFDTMPLIYYMEEHPIYLEIVDPLATAIKSNASFFLTNDIHLPSLPNLQMLKLNKLVKEGQE